EEEAVELELGLAERGHVLGVVAQRQVRLEPAVGHAQRAEVVHVGALGRVKVLHGARSQVAARADQVPAGEHPVVGGLPDLAVVHARLEAQVICPHEEAHDAGGV
ncbi:hypothetical protein EG859_15485, partial [Enterococcus faecalis]